MRYHKSIGFPATLIIPDKEVYLGYTKHAKKRKKRPGQFEIKKVPSRIKINKKNIIEITTDNDVNSEIVLIKHPYTKHKNMIMVLQLTSKKNATVITFWINRKKDKHSSLNTNLYNKPNKQ